MTSHIQASVNTSVVIKLYYMTLSTAKQRRHMIKSAVLAFDVTYSRLEYFQDIGMLVYVI